MNLERGKSYLLVGDLDLTRSFGSLLVANYGYDLNLKKICILNLEDSKDLGVDIQFHTLLNNKLPCSFKITILYEQTELEKLDLDSLDIVLVHGLDYVVERSSLLSILKKHGIIVLATTQYSDALMDNFDFAIKLKRGYRKNERSDISYQIIKPYCDNKVRIKGKFYHFSHYDMSA